MNQPPLPKLPPSASNEARWVLWRNGQHVGPLTTKQVKHLLSSKQITQTELIWGAGRSHWEVIETVPDFQEEKSPEPRIAPADQQQDARDKLWYWEKADYFGNEQIGPCDDQEIRDLVFSGQITETTALAHPIITSNQWLAASDIEFLESWLRESNESKPLVAAPDYGGSLSSPTNTKFNRVITREKLGVCPFPGALVESLIPLFKDRSDPDKQRFNESHYRTFGLGYCVIFVVVLVNVIIQITKSELDVSFLAMTLLGLFLFAAVLTCLHFATHWSLVLSRSVLQNPIYKVSSERHLHIISTPFILLGIGSLGFGGLALYESIGRSFDTGVFSYSSRQMEGFFYAAAQIAVGFVSLFVILRSILNPAHVGVNVDSSATFAETILGVSAVVSRAPLYSCEMIYPFSMVTSVIAITSTFLLQFVESALFRVNLVSLLSIGVAGVIFPLLAYVIAFSGMLTIEFLQAIFEIRRNTKPSE